jgi:hypothetical protein
MHLLDIARQSNFAKNAPVDSALGRIFGPELRPRAKIFLPSVRTFHPRGGMLLEGLMRRSDPRQNARFKNNCLQFSCTVSAISFVCL